MKTLDIKMNGKTAEILFYGTIGDGFDGITAKDFARELKAVGKVSEINLRMNSAGGDVFDGMAIYNTLKRQNARVTIDVDGVALSAASLVAMAGSVIRMPTNATMMIHDPWGLCIGTGDEMHANGDTLNMLKAMFVETYAERTRQETKNVAKMMADETWMTGADALELGFADELIEERRVAAAAYVPSGWYKNTPRELLGKKQVPTPIAEYRERLKAMGGVKA
jgi:ATP-dependent Clp protease, protease subunit